MKTGNAIKGLALVTALVWANAQVQAQDVSAEEAAAIAAGNAPAPAAAVTTRDPNRGAVTNLPLPRYVTLKTHEGNARRGPGLTHRIDWVFTRTGMPLRITAEHENWRRVEDQEGAGGWIHYALLSGVRSVLISADVAELHSSPDVTASVVVKAEKNVIGRIVECQPDWCRLNVDGTKGWAQKSDLWGVDPGEIID